MLDLMILLYSNIYSSMLEALSEVEFMTVDFVFGVGLINLAEMISGLVTISLFFLVIWFPVSIVYMIYKRVKRLLS